MTGVPYEIRVMGSLGPAAREAFTDLSVEVEPTTTVLSGDLDQTALHAVLDQLLDDLRAWARLLADQDQALGVSPLASMPTAAGRTPPHSWHGAASDEEVRRVLGEDLGRLGQHLAAALAEQHDDKVRAALTEVQRGLLVHRQALSEL